MVYLGLGGSRRGGLVRRPPEGPIRNDYMLYYLTSHHTISYYIILHHVTYGFLKTGPLPLVPADRAEPAPEVVLRSARVRAYDD